MNEKCEHTDTWSDGITRFCSDCGQGALIDPDYTYDDDEGVSE